MSKNAKRRLKEIQAKQARADIDRVEGFIKRFEEFGSTLGLGLDDIVHDLKSTEASGINNSGAREQVEYIIGRMGDEGIKRIEDILKNKIG